jgi:pyridoxine 4-dehydrogenase
MVDAISKVHDASAGQIALAWVLKRSPNLLPIPGTSQVSHLEENIAAAEIKSDEEFAQLDNAAKTLSAA